MAEGLEARIAQVRERIAAAARAAGRDPGAIRLIAVSKGQDEAVVARAAAAGLCDFGENYLQELQAKSGALLSRGSDTHPVTWHFQGTLQRRKIRDILPLAGWIQTVARVEEIQEIHKRAVAPVRCLIEVNLASETQKNGAHPDSIASLLTAARGTTAAIVGLMTVPPDEDEPVRWFAALRALAAQHGLTELSMGMSSDYEIAIREGATMVRVGTALFGPRTYPEKRPEPK